jgi:23S rRNA maturation mini-RNase III
MDSHAGEPNLAFLGDAVFENWLGL